MTPPLPNLLIVDDDVALRTAFARALERVGYSVTTATGSPEVLQFIADNEPALVLLDNHMPGTGGIELIQQIRQRWSSEQLPVVLISGSSIQGEIDEAMKAGANDFRRKPVDLADLIATVQDTVRTSWPLQRAGQGSSS